MRTYNFTQNIWCLNFAFSYICIIKSRIKILKKDYAKRYIN